MSSGVDAFEVIDIEEDIISEEDVLIGSKEGGVMLGMGAVRLLDCDENALRIVDDTLMEDGDGEREREGENKEEERENMLCP